MTVIPSSTEKNVILTGFMGTGKSTIGRLVAAELQRNFLDMDDLIEAQEGRAISEIFAERGESYFRRLETDLCRGLAQQQNLVIATGGGTLVLEKNLRMMDRTGLIVCLDCDPEVLWTRIGHSQDRPMLAEADEHRFARLSNLLEQRSPAYQRIAFHLNVTYLSPQQAAQRICAYVTNRLDTSF